MKVIPKERESLTNEYRNEIQIEKGATLINDDTIGRQLNEQGMKT